MGASVWFVALYEHSWGRGRSVEEAKRRARANGGHGTAWFVKRLPPGAEEPWVDDLGGIRWTWVGEGDGNVRRLPVVAAGRTAPREIRERVEKE